MRTISAAEGRLELKARGMNLVRHLGGHWYGGAGICLCPAHDDRLPSLSVRPGHTDLLFKCFAGCDTLEVMRAIARLGPIPSLIAPASVRAHRAETDGAWLRERAAELWMHARDTRGTVVERYLTNRAIDLLSPAIRFHPRAPLGPSGRVVFRPAMLAAVQEGRRIVAVQRTFLEPNRARRARDLGNPRRLLGRPGRGAVMLAAATHVLGLAEGVETALAAMIRFHIPVWAVLGNERLATIAIPRTVEHLVLLPDNDRAGRRAEALAREAHGTGGRVIETMWPDRGLNDWNDVLLTSRSERRSRPDEPA